MIIEDVVAFLREAPPLCFLEPARLAGLARTASLDFYPAGADILAPGAGAGFAHALKAGRVLCGGQMYEEGDLITAHAGSAVVVEDAVSCLLPPQALAEALTGRPELSDFLEGRLSDAVLELGMAGMVRDIPAWLSGRPLASVRLAEAVRRKAAPCQGVDEHTSVQAVAQGMTGAGCDAVVVLARSGEPAGVVTDRDFRAKAVAQGLPPDTPVRLVMTAPVVSLDGGASCFEALMAMTRHHIRHVVVMEGARALGVVSAQDLMLGQVGSPPALAARAARAGSMAELADVAAGLDRLALTLLREGAGAASLGRMVGGVRDAVAARAFELAEQQLGPAPGGFCLVLFGRAARREGPALCPLWHGLIHEDTPGAAAWAEACGGFLAKAFDAVQMGCAPGAPSAASPEWRGALEAWRGRVTAWLDGEAPTRDWLDFRPVQGQAWLAEALRAHMLALSVGRAQEAPMSDDAPLVEQMVELVRSRALLAGVTRIASVERALALEAVGRCSPELARAAAYLTAWPWVGEPLRRGAVEAALDRAVKRMCRKAAEEGRA